MATSTAAQIDNILAGGVTNLKQRMAAIRDTIKAQNEKADTMEKENTSAHEALCRVIGQQEAIKQKIESKLFDLEKSEKRVKEIEPRVLEKEQFLRESTEFNNSLQVVAANEGAIEEKQQEVNMYTDLYNKNYEKYQTTKTKKMELEQRFELIEFKSAETERRLNALKLELEYNLIEEGRRSQECKETMDSAFRTEKHCLDLQRGLDVVMKTKAISTKKVNELEAEIHRSEDSLEATMFERRRIEATIREMLKSKVL